MRYDDPDDGSGQPAIVDATVTIDCRAGRQPGRRQRQLTSMTVHALTDEAARFVVRWGTSCAALEQTAIGPVATSHAVLIAGLSFTDYFFALQATDAAERAGPPTTTAARPPSVPTSSGRSW